MTRVAYIGNFKHAHCTEVALAYGFRQHGCEVIEVQEDRATPEYVSALTDLDLCLYTRTHNVHALGADWTALWRHLEDRGTQTAAFHLDRFWGLARERAVWDREPMFTVGTLFTADGGNDGRWVEAGVNHVWLPPAIDARYAVEGWGPRSPVKADVLFVGSTGYHREYPQRDTLVRYLKNKYGDRFLHVGHGSRLNVRPRKPGDDPLADLIAACGIVVGDSCFANGSDGMPHRGAANYWSDRVPETLGRAGLLVHPDTPGLDDAFAGLLLTHAPGDWRSLTTVIDHALSLPLDERQTLSRAGQTYVQSHHTYTERARTILETLGLMPTQLRLDGERGRLERAVRALADEFGSAALADAVKKDRRERLTTAQPGGNLTA